MGKCKKRLIARARNSKSQMQISREDALNQVYKELDQDPSSITAKNLISLFGLSAEELSEAGVTYEILRSLDGLIR